MDKALRESERTQKLTALSVSQEQQQSRQATSEAASAAYRQSLADRAVAQLNLKRSEVISPVDGTVTNVNLEPGDCVTAGKGVMALVNRATLRVEGYSEKTKLPRIHVGDPVHVRLMGNPNC